VRLTPPADWPTTFTPQAATARRPGGGLMLEWSPLRLLPERQAAWVTEILARNLAPGSALVDVKRELTATGHGLPMLLAQARVVVGGAPAAIRLAAFYAFLEHGGHALIHAEDLDAFAAEEAALRRVLFDAAPDFSGPLVSVEDFFRGSPFTVE
jgi:hypothetical protein